MKAIKDTGNVLLAALDKNDSVGIIDNYFPEADFFTEFERFDRHVEKLRRQGTRIDFLTVCSPNYLHDAHIRFGLRIGADVICEKPIVLNPWNVDGLLEIEKDTGGSVYSIMQLRHHPSVEELKKRIAKAPAGKRFKVDIKYITFRGHWYQNSWKGDVSKSGGIATNIGLHFFDILIWIFGKVQENKVHHHSAKMAAGTLQLEKADVEWMVSIDPAAIPASISDAGKKTYRCIIVDGDEIELSEAFSDLHTISYREILSGNGIGLKESRDIISLVHDIRNATISH
jgi:UDP-N-acetyl-2-amino-2-deoxyglucuronate dehydrogenase